MTPSLRLVRLSTQSINGARLCWLSAKSTIGVSLAFLTRRRVIVTTFMLGGPGSHRDVILAFLGVS